MTLSVKQALCMATELRSISDSSLLDTEIILSFALSRSREYLRAYDETQLTRLEEDNFIKLFNRRKLGEPIAYIVEKCSFWGFDLFVNSSVLIPRPETERLVEFALELASEREGPICIADLGTGSGAIALALARESAHWDIHAVEISDAAMEVARINARILGVNNIEFHMGSWCDGLPDERFDLIIANPPYIAQGDNNLLAGDLSYEPPIALVSEESGYSALNEIVDKSYGFLKNGAWLLIEHGYDQQESLLSRLESIGYSDITGHKDFSGLDRIVMARGNI